MKIVSFRGSGAFHVTHPNNSNVTLCMKDCHGLIGSDVRDEYKQSSLPIYMISYKARPHRLSLCENCEANFDMYQIELVFSNEEGKPVIKPKFRKSLKRHQIERL